MVGGLKGSARETVCEFVLLIFNKVDRQNKGCFILSYKFQVMTKTIYKKIVFNNVLLTFLLIRE